MKNYDHKLSLTDLAAARERFQEAEHVQDIEGNPLSEETIAMFEMFDQKAWAHERCTQYILERIQVSLVK